MSGHLTVVIERGIDVTIIEVTTIITKQFKDLNHYTIVIFSHPVPLAYPENTYGLLFVI